MTATLAMLPVREDDAVADLAASLGPLCREAVDRLEVAAALEADGLSDQAAHDRYGHADVFALAEELYRRVPRCPDETVTAASPWRSRPGEHLLNGVLFSLPGLCYATAAYVVTTPAAAAVLVLSLVVAWGLGQLLSYLGYLCAGRRDAGGTAVVLRHGLLVTAAVTWALTAGAAAALHAGTAVLVLALGQGLYLLAATVVMVSGGGRWLLLTLAPGTLASAVFVAAGPAAAARPPAVVWLASGLSVAATLALALWRTRAPTPRPTRPARPVRLADVRAGAPYAAFGVLAGGLLSWPMVDPRVLADHTGPAAQVGAGMALLPLSLSMGAAEWILYWYRDRTHRVLTRARRLRDFAVRARLLLLAAVGRYVLVTAAITAAACAAERAAAAPVVPLRHLAYLVLGTAFFVALVLQSFRRVAVVLVTFPVALAAEVTAVRTGSVAGLSVDVASVQLTAGLGLLVALGTHAVVTLGRAARHR
jgi:hypothetical protein